MLGAAVFAGPEPFVAPAEDATRRQTRAASAKRIVFIRRSCVRRGAVIEFRLGAGTPPLIPLKGEGKRRGENSAQRGIRQISGATCACPARSRVVSANLRTGIL